MTSASHSARDTEPRTAKDHDQLRAELLARIEQAAPGAERAGLHVQLGHLLRGQFLDGVAALRHFQDAFKADPLRLDAVGAARTVYRQIGRLPLVERLLALEIEALGSSAAAADLYRELGDVLLDSGNASGAARAYDSAVERGAAARELLVDAEVGEGGWAARVEELATLAESAAEPGEQVSLLLRAAAVARPYSADRAFELVAAAYRLDPENERAASLFEGAYVESDAIEELVAAQEELLSSEQGSRLYEVFGARWAHRHVPEVSVPLLLEALRRNPGLEPAVTHVYVASAEVPEAPAQLVEVAEAVGPSVPATATYLLATAALVAAQDLNNISKARSLAEQLLRLDDTHPVALALTGRAAPKTEESRASTAPAKEKRDMTQDPRNMEETSTEATELEESVADSADETTSADDAAAVSTSAAAAAKAAPSAASPTEVLQLREKLAAAEKRPHEYVKLLIQLGDALGSDPEAADRYREAALLYAEKSNAAEASKAYEKLLAVDVTDASARAYLRDVYEKQRKFDKLVDLMKQEADALDAGPDRASAYKQIAVLATDKIKKPEICVELWSVVLDNDAEDVDALSALVGLYERARDYEKLVDALERVVVVTYDDNARVEYLTKLGQIAGDRLKDEERAAEAYRQLLVLRPDDRRAQEQLKKRYVALGRWDDLEVFYQESGNWEEFIRLLESNESKAETQAAQIGMLGKIAELWITQKGQPDRAARALEKVLTIDSSNLDAAERLIPIYESGNNPKGLVAAIEVKLGHVHDPAGRIELLTRVASLYDERLRDKASALARYLEAVKLDPSNSANLDAAEKVAEGAKTWDALVSAYKDTVPGADDDSAVALRLRLGRILSDKLGKPDEAIAEYRAVYDDHPDNTEALSALEALYQKTGGWKELLEVYEQKLSLPLELEERKATQYGIARVQREKLDDAELAIETYETVLAEDADDTVALAALDELYGATKEWEKQARTISQRIERAEPDGSLVELKFRLAEVQAQKLGRSDEALENYREVLQLDLAHPGARASLEGFLDDEDLKGEAARILETVLEQQEAWEKLARVLEVRASVESGAERVELLRKLAVVSAEHLGSPEEAMNAQARALKADPTNETARSELEALAERSRALPALAKIFSLIAGESKDEEVALDYHMRVARLHERLSDVDSAAAAYAKALGVDAAHQPALLALDALYRGAGRYADLVGVYKKRIELAVDPDEFESLHAALAEVLDSQLGQPEQAVVAYQDVLEQAPSSRVALSALDALFTKLERWDDLATNLESQLALAETEGESIELTLRLAALRETKMGQIEAAIDGYREVLEKDASEARGLLALERLLGQPKYELVVGEILEPIYRSSGQYQKLISVHEIQLKKSDEVERKVELLDAIRELYEDAGGNSGAAFDAAARALEIDPSSDRIRATLTRLAAATDRFRDLGAILEQRAAASDDKELASQLYSAGAVVFEESVGDSARAIELYKKVLAVDPTALSAAEALERLYRQTEQFAEMSRILQKKAGMLDDVELQKQALYAAATLEEDVLEQPEKAIAVYEQVLELDAEDVRSVEALIGLLLGLARWKDLLAAYARKVDLVFDIEEKKQVLYEVGAVHERELSDVESAIDTYQRVLELDPDDLIALGRLDVLYQTAENWSELLSVLTREAELAADPEESVSYQFRVAKLYETRLGDVERAVDLYRELLQVQPDHEATLAALEQLQKGSKAALAASQVLEQVYEASADAEKLLAALEVQVAHAEDAFQKVGLLRRIAQIAEESLSAPERAFAVYARAVAADSSNGEVLESFERLATMTDGWKRAAEVYDAELASKAEDPAQVVELGLRVAQIYEVQLEDSRSAVQRYQTVLEAESANLVALAALDRLFSAAEDWVSLAKVLAEEAEYGDSPEAILEFKFRLGEVSRSHLGNVPAAIAAYREVLAAAPEHEGALGALEQLLSRGIEVLAIAETLEPLYQVAGEWEKLLALREAVLAKVSAAESRVELLQRMSEEAESKLGDVDRAFEYLVRALGEAPENETTFTEIERLADVADEGWERLANAYADVMSTDSATGAVIATSGRRLARVYEEQLSDTERAVETYRFVLGRVPADLAALENLDRIYTAAESWSKLAPVLEVRAKAVEDTFDKVELYLRLGHTYEEKLAPLGDLGTVDRSVLGGGELSRGEAARRAPSAGADVLGADEEELIADDETQVAEPSLDELFPAEAAEADASADDFGATEAEVTLTDSAPAAKETAQAGPLNAERLQDAIRAYRVVFDGLEPENQDAIESLERVYRVTGEWKNLDVVFQRQLDNSSGDSEEADVRAKRAHLAADQLGDLPGAVAGWKRVLDLRGEDPEALRALAHLYEKQGQWSELTDVLERHFDIADSDDDRVHVLLMRAKLFDEQLNRDEEALETYRRALDIDYSNVTALRAIAKIWRRRQDDDELITALHAFVDQGAAQVEQKELVEAFRELAKLYQDKKEQPFEAADAWRRLLEVGPGDFEALDRLEGIYRADSQWTDIIDVKMQRASALALPEEKVRELLEVTDLWKQEVREYDKATTAYARVLAVEPTHQRAFVELEKLHSHAERYEQLIELYLNRLEHTEEVPARSDLLRRIARVFEEKLGDHDQAFDALVNAFADDYYDDETANFLGRVCQAANRWPELLTNANAWLQQETDRRKKIQLSLRLGKWYGEDLGRPADATAYYQVVLEIDPNNTRVMRQMAAIERLGGNYQRAGQMLNKALEVAVANDDRKAILGDLGDVLYRNLEQVDQAIPYYKRALDVDAGYMPALTALERIYEDKGQIPELIEILTRKATSVDRSEDAVKMKLRLGELCEERLGDAEGAAKAYREALAVDESSLAALRGLERTLFKLGQWAELIKALEQQLDIVDTERERVRVLMKLAEIHEQQFLKPDVAAQRLEQALEIDHAQEEGYVALARCYRRLKQWNDLVRTYERHLEATHSRDTKLELYAAIGAVYRDELGELDRAIDSYQAVVDADDTNIAALDALAKLYERQDDSARAIDMMTRVADLTADGAQRVDMYFRIGRAMEEKLGDRFGAREKFQIALDLNPSHLQSLAALRTIAVDEADWDAACRYLEQEASHTDAPRQKARLLVELGKIRDEMLSERDSAIAAYEQAIALDEDCEEAALPLVKEYGERERWADAAPLAEMLARRSKNREKPEQHELQKLLGNVMSKLGDHDKALKAYLAAHQLDLTDQETIRGVADAAYALTDWATALTNYQKVLTALGEGDVEARTDVYFRLGKIKEAQSQDKQAINNYEKALALDGEHRPSLEALVEVYGKTGDHQQVAAYKRQILDTIFDGEERFAILCSIGDLWSEKVNQPLKALEAYEEARDLKPQDHVLLHKMVRCYQQAEEWQKMVDVLDAILAIEERPKLKAKLLNTQAQIYRDMLEDKAKAVELFNEALDLDPEFLEAFERINKMLTTERNWKQLERSYRKMLHRIAGKNKQELEHQLWHQLGLIYRDRTGQTQEAVQAFKMSAELSAGDAVMQRQILAELYEQSEQWDDAIKEQRKLLKADPLNPDAYQALYRLYLHKQAYDESWALAAALAFMGKADGDQMRFYEDYRPKGMLRVAGRFGEEHWQRALIHPEQTQLVSEVFKMITSAAVQAKLTQLKAQNKLPKLDERFRQDPATSTITFAKTFGWASQVLGVQPPTLYVRNDVSAYLGAVASSPPASVAGQVVLSGFQPEELTFICGKHLALYRPEAYLKVLFPTQAELTIMFFAGVLLAAPQTPMPPDMEQPIRAAAQELARHMQPVHVEGLKQAVKAWLAAGAKANIKRWSQAVEHTACRAGLIVCCDLNVAKKIIASEQQNPGDPTAQELLKELLTFAVSVEYSALRKVLGVNVQA